MSHEIVEKKVGLMGALIAIVISIGGLVEIVPLYAQRSVVEPSPGVTPYGPLALEGRDVYVREGCYNCHSQMIRPLPAETERYGHYSLAGETVYDHPFQFGSKRTGPDLARVGGRYTDEWHRVHLMNPRDVVPESNMPGFPWLAERALDPDVTQAKMRALRRIGVPYTVEEVAAAPAEIANRTEMDALIAYMQGMKFRGAPKDARAAEVKFDAAAAAARGQP
jgi:cytochrome c oxidase cbb3-type subunit 2